MRDRLAGSGGAAGDGELDGLQRRVEDGTALLEHACGLEVAAVRLQRGGGPRWAVPTSPHVALSVRRRVGYPDPMTIAFRLLLLATLAAVFALECAGPAFA
jgi:hypothetical protein